MKRWYVVYTQPKKEERALWHLRNQGFECFLPRYRKLRRHARRMDSTLEPLFHRYLFARFDAATVAWRTINGTRGVVGLLASETCPKPVPDGVVETLQDRTDQDGATPLTALGVLTRGLKVRVLSGPFADQRGVVTAVPQGIHDRVQILLTLLGVPTHLSVPDYAIETV